MEGPRRIQQRQDSPTTNSLPSMIGFATLTATPTVIVSASPTVPFSTQTSASITSADSAGGTISATDAASTTKSASTSTSDASKATSSNLSTLIPAIVAPVAAVLLISFIAFWLFMRRRSKKAAKDEPEFVMEGMKEKPYNRPVTSNSNSSTQDLVPDKNNKETAVMVKEVDRSAFGNFPDTKETDFAPPRLESAMDSRPGSRQADQSGTSKAIPNFSRGPRSNTVGKDSAPLPVPGFTQQKQGGSRPRHHPPASGPNTPGARQNPGPRGPAQSGPLSQTESRPSQPRAGSFSRPLGPPLAVSRNPPAALITRPNRPSQEGNPYQQSAGAYNGSSPISQYSPIVKDMPKFGTSPMAVKPNAQSRGAGGSISSMNDQGIRKPPPSAIKTSNSPLSPADPSFSDENMRIARLAHNNRLALHSVVATTAATSPATEEPPTPSPRLPPPATRDAPPTNYNIPLPTQEPPAPASIQARLNGVSISDRRSVVSGLSDDYVDMEVDNKSDVSSLDEREKWQMMSETEKSTSRQAGLGGYGGLGPRPPLLSKESHNSEASQYSLGYYTKDRSRSGSR